MSLAPVPERVDRCYVTSTGPGASWLRAATLAGDLPWDEYVAALRPQGKLCIIETLAMAEADRALERNRSGKARFRVVLVA